MDLLDQQLLLAQYNEAGRNATRQPQVHAQIECKMKGSHWWNLDGQLLSGRGLCVHVCACRLGYYSGPGCYLLWGTVGRMDPQCSPNLRLRHTSPLSHHHWTILLLQRNRFVSYLSLVVLGLYTFLKFGAQSHWILIRTSVSFLFHRWHG